jgi:hypothetical protein
MDVENKDSPGRAGQSSLSRVRLASVMAGFQHPRVSMRPRYYARRTIVLSEVHESADRVAAVPHARLTLSSPIDVQGLLAVPRLNTT